MSDSHILNEQSIICRACLKVLEKTGFTYIDDENGYVKDVGSIREMLQFCIPELDLYVSSDPALCYQCLKMLVEVYNFKIKCLNVENIVKAYINRNNLQEYNHVNLNCVLMDDLKMKSQSIQIESRIKDMMLRELPEGSETPPDDTTNQVPQLKEEVEKSPVELINMELLQSTLEDPPLDIDVHESKPLIELDNVDDYENDTDSSDSDSDFGKDEVSESDGNDKDKPKDKPPSVVAVRKDLFSTNSEVKSPSLIVNNPVINQNGKIIIKIDRSCLKPLTLTSSNTATNNVIVTPAVISTSSLDVSQPSVPAPPPKIVSVETVEGSNAEERTENTDSVKTMYNCNKCNYITEDVIEMYDHNRSFHNFDYTCQHCPFSTSKVELLGKHMTMVHPQKMVSQKTLNFKVTENYACTLCPFSVKNIDLLRSHHMAAHGKTDISKGPVLLNKAFNDDLKHSEPRILKRLEYTCDVCPYTTKDKSNLRKHLFTHGTKPLKCEHCTYKCVSPYQLRRHQKQKHGKTCDPRSRNQPYPLPDFRKEKAEAMDSFKITLESIKREIEKEISST